VIIAFFALLLVFKTKSVKAFPSIIALELFALIMTTDVKESVDGQQLTLDLPPMMISKAHETTSHVVHDEDAAWIPGTTLPVRCYLQDLLGLWLR